MPTNEERADWAQAAVESFCKKTGCDEQEAVGDLIANLMHLAEQQGQDALDRVRNGIMHWYSEKHAEPGDELGPECRIQIIVNGPVNYEEGSL